MLNEVVVLVNLNLESGISFYIKSQQFLKLNLDFIKIEHWLFWWRADGRLEIKLQRALGIRIIQIAMFGDGAGNFSSERGWGLPNPNCVEVERCEESKF